MSEPRLPLLVTHSGSFHCDEAFAYVALRLALGLHAPGHDHVLLRTRDAGRIAEGDVVWDVGLVYDTAAQRFDHHQRGAPVRPDGTPFSSAGLVWQTHGEAAVRALLRPEDSGFAKAITADLDASMVRFIDEVDNGVATSRGSMDLASLVSDCNPAWDTLTSRSRAMEGNRPTMMNSVVSTVKPAADNSRIGNNIKNSRKQRHQRQPGGPADREEIRGWAMLTECVPSW